MNGWAIFFRPDGLEFEFTRGGFFGFRPPKQGKILRKTQDGEKIVFDLTAVFEKGDLSKDLVIQDGDLIVLELKKVDF